MYNEIKLEKGLYNLAGKSFSQALEEADPTENYKDTPLCGLDAFERQLKRFGIRVKGRDCDKVEKFFATTESAVLFPEFVRRAVVQGMEESVLPQLVAVKTVCEGNQYRGYTVSETDSYLDGTAQGAVLPETSILESDNNIQLVKYGRLVTASYEAVRLQKLDVFTLTMRSIGKKLADAISSAAVAALKTGAASISTAGELSFDDVKKLFSQFSDYSMKSMIVSPKNAAMILSMEQVRDSVTVDENGNVILPFGTKLIKSSQIGDDSVIGFDSSYALEYITSSDLVMETDKLIDRQLDTFTVSVNLAFKKVINDAVKVLKLA